LLFLGGGGYYHRSGNRGYGYGGIGLGGVIVIVLVLLLLTGNLHF